MLSKKHFEAIVKILANNKYKEHTDLLNDFCNFFKSENPNFSNERFLDKYNKLTSQIDVERIETMFERPEVAYKNAVNTLKRSIKRKSLKLPRPSQLETSCEGFFIVARL